MVADTTYGHGWFWPLIETLGKHVSLINQVLQNVEARQGSQVLDGRSDAAGWGSQVKPVLSHQGVDSRAWIKRLVWACVLLALVIWLLVNRSSLLSYFHPVQVTAPASKTMVPQVAPPSREVEFKTEAVPAQGAPTWEPPQLTRSLFSAWQAGPSAAASPVPVRNKPATAPASASVKAVAAPQVEGEFTIKPAEAAAANPVVSVVEPPLEVANAVKLAKTNESESGPRGVVNKQLRPDQEVNLLIQRAVDHEQKGRLSEALATLRQALTTYPQSEDARQLLAAYLFESRQEVEAVLVLQAGIKQYPGQIGLAKSLAKWQLSHGQPDAVLQTLKPVANTLIQDAESQWMLAMAYQQTAQHVAALPHFERAIALQPGRAQSMVAHAISLQAAGQPTRALQQFQLAYQLPLSDRMSEFVSQRIRQLGGTVTAYSE
jgi:MSHA biogenesis protein MshN